MDRYRRLICVAGNNYLDDVGVDAVCSILDDLNDRCLLCKDENMVSCQIYTIVHKFAYIDLQQHLLGDIKPYAYAHDCDKIVLYKRSNNKKQTSTIHKLSAPHHVNKESEDKYFEEAVIDYECGRFTKVDKPWTAFEFITLFEPNMYCRFKPKLQALGLDTEEHTTFPAIARSSSEYERINKAFMGYVDMFKDIYDANNNMKLSEKIKNFYNQVS